MKITHNLKKLLDGNNLSQIAQDLNIPKQRLHDWSYGGVTPSFKKASEILKIANYFNLSFYELVFGDVDNQLETYRFKARNGTKFVLTVLEQDNKF